MSLDLHFRLDTFTTATKTRSQDLRTSSPTKAYRWLCTVLLKAHRPFCQKSHAEMTYLACSFATGSLEPSLGRGHDCRRKGGRHEAIQEPEGGGEVEEEEEGRGFADPRLACRDSSLTVVSLL